MKTNEVPKQDEVLSGSILSTIVFSHIHTTRITKVVRYDGYDFSMTIIKPFFANQRTEFLPVFLFVPSTSTLATCFASTVKIASELVIASGQAAVIIDNDSSIHSECSIFKFFAAMKWIFWYGKEAGINGNKMAIVGTHLGANIVTILSLMALNDDCPDLSVQILIDPQFFSSHHSFAHQHQHTKAERTEQGWLNMNCIHNLPLDSKIEDLSGSPPTLVQLSRNTRNHCELEYYCVKLLHAGTDVTYINYDENDEEPDNGSLIKLNKNLIARTAEELKKFG